MIVKLVLLLAPWLEILGWIISVSVCLKMNFCFTTFNGSLIAAARLELDDAPADSCSPELDHGECSKILPARVCALRVASSSFIWWSYCVIAPRRPLLSFNILAVIALQWTGFCFALARCSERFSITFAHAGKERFHSRRRKWQFTLCTCGVSHDVDQLCQLCPSVSCEWPFGEDVCQLLCCVDVFDLNHWI